MVKHGNLFYNTYTSQFFFFLRSIQQSVSSGGLLFEQKIYIGPFWILFSFFCAPWSIFYLYFYWKFVAVFTTFLILFNTPDLHSRIVKCDLLQITDVYKSMEKSNTHYDCVVWISRNSSPRNLCIYSVCGLYWWFMRMFYDIVISWRFLHLSQYHRSNQGYPTAIQCWK